MRHPVLAIVAASVALSACDKPPEPRPEAPSTAAATPAPDAASPGPSAAAPGAASGTKPMSRDPEFYSASEVRWTKPDAWRMGESKSAMRLGTFVVPKAPGDAEDGECTVIVAGGSADANVRRWEQQFGGAKAKIEQREVNGLKLVAVEIAGTFQSGMPGSPGAGVEKKDWAMLAAILPVGRGGKSYFFKLTGPKKTVERARADWDVFLGSLRKVV